MIFPVIRHENIRSLLAIATENYYFIEELLLHQIDVSNAYFSSELQETVHMKQPEDFISKKYPSRVLIHKKALYGLKPSDTWLGIALSTTH